MSEKLSVINRTDKLWFIKKKKNSCMCCMVVLCLWERVLFVKVWLRKCTWEHVTNIIIVLRTRGDNKFCAICMTLLCVTAFHEQMRFSTHSQFHYMRQMWKIIDVTMMIPAHDSSTLAFRMRWTSAIQCYRFQPYGNFIRLGRFYNF